MTPRGRTERVRIPTITTTNTHSDLLSRPSLGAWLHGLRTSPSGPPLCAEELRWLEVHEFLVDQSFPSFGGGLEAGAWSPASDEDHQNKLTN